MTSRTHYKVLGLAPEAPLPVIRAAHRALVLVYHPDKTLHMSPAKRAEHAAVFRDVQAAFGVLNTPGLKAAYDIELEQHDNKIDPDRTTIHRADSLRRKRSTRVSSPKPETSICMTTPAEKLAMKSKVDDQLAQLKLERKKRDEEDESLTYDDLKYTLKLWKDIADEEGIVPSMHAHCQIKIHEYEQKISVRNLQHERWLEDISKPKSQSSEHFPSPIAHPESEVPTPAKPSTSRTPRRPTQQKLVNRHRAEEQKWIVENNIDKIVARFQGRSEEKARQDALKQARAESKAAAVRAEKEKHKKKTEEERRKVAERIASARSKAKPASTKHRDESASAPKRLEQERVSSISEVTRHKPCTRCDNAHNSVAEWKKCSIANAKAPKDEASFFQAV